MIELTLYEIAKIDQLRLIHMFICFFGALFLFFIVIEGRKENKQNEKPMLRTLLNFQPLNRLKNHFQLQWLSISLAHSWNLLLNNESLQPSVLSTTCRKQKLRKQWEYQKVPLRPTYITPEMHSAVRSASLKYKIGMEK